MSILCRLSNKQLVLLALRLLKRASDVHIKAFVRIVREYCKEAEDVRMARILFSS
jgi:hypothetical protein